MSKYTDLAESITASMIAKIEEGIATGENWVRPWDSIGLDQSNATTGNRYNGMNILVLAWQADTQGFKSAKWATRKQWVGAGYEVPSLTDDQMVECCKWSVIPDKRGPQDENGEYTRTTMVPNVFRVINSDLVPDYVDDSLADAPDRDYDPIADVEEYIAAIGLNITYAGGRAFYSPGSDSIQIPELNDFHSVVEFYSTLLHECGHATGHKSRLNRKLTGQFGSPDYAKEELIAELTAAILCQKLGIVNEPRADHAEYLANWLKAMKAEPTLLLRSMAAADKACTWLDTAASAGLLASV